MYFLKLKNFFYFLMINLTIFFFLSFIYLGKINNFEIRKFSNGNVESDYDF